MQDTIVKNNSSQGILVQGTGSSVKSTIEHCQLWGNLVGVLNSGASNLMLLRNTMVSKNGASGIAADTGGRIDITDCYTGNNGTGINSDSGSEIKVARTTIVRNSTNGLGLSGGTILSYGNNEINGNVGNETFSPGGPTLH